MNYTLTASKGQFLTTGFDATLFSGLVPSPRKGSLTSLGAGTTAVKDKFQKLLSGEPIPQLPDWNARWTLADYKVELEHFHRRLLEYIRRLFTKITDANIVSVASGQGIADWRYHQASNKFEIKRFQEDGTVGDWEEALPDQPVTAAELYDWRYHVATHKFQYKTQNTYLLYKAAASDWADAPADQPIPAGGYLTDMTYDTGTHEFEQFFTNAIYVLEGGGTPDDNVIVTLVDCNE